MSRTNSKIARDTVFLAAVQVALQGAGLLLNVFITKFFGAGAVGVISLSMSFFAYGTTLAGGNIFTSTGRFVSEEIGKGGNPYGIMRYAVTLAVGLSSLYCIGFFAFAGGMSEKIFGSAEHSAAIRILALSLPLATLGNCIKGYFHARRTVKIPAISDSTEFLLKAATLIVTALIFSKSSDGDIFTAVAVSVCAGEVASCLFLALTYFFKGKECENVGEVSIKSFSRYLRAIFPIAANGYIFVLLCSLNEALIPLTLKGYGGSPERAIAEYGILEGIIMPTLYFPAVILQSLSMILTQESARHSSAGNKKSVAYITEKALRRTFGWSGFALCFMLCCGGDIGKILCDNPLAAKMIPVMAPVIPFIYSEIVISGILGGLGRQNFCTIVSAAEYGVRITAMLILVPRFGFYGIAAAYYISNVCSNLARIIAVVKYSGVRFSPIKFVLTPLLSAALSGFIGSRIASALSESKIIHGAVFALTAGAIYLICYIALSKITSRNTAKGV